MAFRLFHGRDGVVPLSEQSSLHTEKAEPETAPPKFNPLAAKAATISLSSFGPGGPFSFDAFSNKWNNQKEKSKPSKKESSSQVIEHLIMDCVHLFADSNLGFRPMFLNLE